ncbi:MAG TPA: hypothetical protein GXX77_03825 [Candidatus Cloacimonetes bacterium]|nr:hypothetical protein [Candidatus Cloacimonadota bacterium]
MISFKPDTHCEYLGGHLIGDSQTNIKNKPTAYPSDTQAELCSALRVPFRCHLPKNGGFSE